MAAKFVTGRNARADEGSQQPSSRNSWNTIQPDPKRSQPYSTSMTLAFALTAIMTATVLVAVLGIVWEGQFKAYTRQNMQALANSAAESISTVYQREGSWDGTVLAEAKNTSAMSSDVGIQIIGPDGQVLYDDTWEHTRESAGHADPVSNAPTGTDSAVTAPILGANDTQVGTLRLWAFGSETLLTRADAAFRSNSYGAIAVAAAIAVVLACVIGYFTSKRLSTPIQRITNTARQLRNGDLTARSGVRGSDEIGQLGETFDDMATSLERDLKLEHRLTGDVAHELRTPLMAMQATVEAMLKLSRLENGSTELKTERTDVVYLIRSLVTSQHQLFHEKGLHLRFVDESQYGELNADIDPDLIREAVVNLMSNAMRYTDEDGWVMVTVRQDKSDVLIAVQDTGIGIAKEDIPQTFSRFWRSDVSRERVSGGLGVGLSLTKEIVDKHNGTILVESELGKGTTFTLRIPQNRGRRNLAQAIQEG